MLERRPLVDPRSRPLGRLSSAFVLALVPPRAEAFSCHTLARSEQRNATFCEESCSCSTAGMLRVGRLVRGVYFRWPVPSYQGLRCHSAMFQVSESHGVAL